MTDIIIPADNDQHHRHVAALAPAVQWWLGDWWAYGEHRCVMDNSVARTDGGTDVAKYDPEKGLKTIAVAEAGEKHWARAKDPSKLFDAIAAKVKAQAEYVCWRDGKVKHGGDRKSKNQDRADANLIPDGDPGHDIASRWRKSFCLKVETGTVIDQEKMRLALDDAQARALRVVEQQPKGTERGTAGTGEFERYTPAEYIEAAREVLGSVSTLSRRSARDGSGAK